MPVNSSTLGLLVIAASIIFFIESYSSFSDYRKVKKIRSDRQTLTNSGNTVAGRVDVTDPATTPNEPSAVRLRREEPPALIAWRTQRPSANNRGSNTMDGGLASGEFTIFDNGRYIRVPELQVSTSDAGTFDPFDSDHVLMGLPERSVRLGEPSSLDRFLTRFGILGEDSLLGWQRLPINVRRSGNPSRYEETSIGDGDDIAIQGGEVTETGGDPRLQFSDANPPKIINSNLDMKMTQLKFKAGQQLAIGVGLIAFAEVVSRIL